MSKESNLENAGAIRIVMKRAAMTSDEQKEFIEDLARASGVPVDEIGNYSFIATRAGDPPPRVQK